MQYSQLNSTAFRLIGKTEFEALADQIQNEFDYDGVKTCITRYFAGRKGDGKKKTALLSTCSSMQADYKSFQAKTVVFEKLIKQVKKDIVQVKKEQVMLTFYFWPIACYKYTVTTKKGEYTFTVPVESKIDLD